MGEKAGSLDVKKIGGQFRKRRIEIGMTLRDVANAVGIAPSQLSRIETGKTGSARSTLVAIARHLDLSFPWMVSSDEDTFSQDERQLLKVWRKVPGEYRRSMLQILGALGKLSEADLKIVQSIGPPINDRFFDDVEHETVVDLIPPTRIVPLDGPPKGHQRLRELGRAAAGDPIWGVRGPDEVDVPDEFLVKQGNYAAVRVVGDSMDLEGIEDGCVVAYRNHGWQAGAMVLAQIDDEEHTIKRYWRRNNVVKLYPRSSNPEHQIQEYSAAEVRIMGVVVAYRDLNGQWHHVDIVRPAELEYM